MSRPVSSGESLEAILASIRRSLAEQATDALDEEGAAPSEPMGGLDAPPLPGSHSRQDVDAPDALQGDAPDPGEADALDDEPPPAMFARSSPAPAPAPAPQSAPDPEPSPGSAAAVQTQEAPQADQQVSPKKDPLWFLSHETAQQAAAQPAGTPPKAVPGSPRGVPPTGEASPTRAPEAKSARAGVVRGPLPPFFGSSAETVKVEIAPEPPVLSGAATIPPVVQAPPPPEPARSVNGHAQRIGGLHDAQGTPRPADGLLNGKASAIFGPAAADAKAGGAETSPQIQALEVMVAELLRPMLRRWLDENMPRLVSAALKVEAESMSDRDRKKS